MAQMAHFLSQVFGRVDLGIPCVYSSTLERVTQLVDVQHLKCCCCGFDPHRAHQGSWSQPNFIIGVPPL